ncbi:hypothetical protein TRFO_03165 [Tritrichomonas foetus]|uniref:Uncharacterized protein n=1 Tax=Tritrichomonas foetus TaxID=1144522 RepID=A0A1J4KS95_9EUKA|nr:hypothetical protein TRFO_03165 [Tritrichomonas foetus]|eukprot:OHT14131.1 hypothetical protein TRFO_03165 [Tritrichomonas foetus]
MTTDPVEGAHEAVQHGVETTDNATKDIQDEVNPVLHDAEEAVTPVAHEVDDKIGKPFVEMTSKINNKFKKWFKL